MAYDPTKDNHKYEVRHSGDPGTKASAVVTSDTVDLTVYAKMLYVGVAGDVVVIPVGQTAAVTFKAHPVGYLNLRVARVNATGTTATNIVAIYD